MSEPVGNKRAEPDLRKLFYALHPSPEQERALMRTVWKDGIDLELPNDFFLRLVAALAAERGPSPPPDVLAALDRMCTPLHESRLSGATARCMALIRDYIMGHPTESQADKPEAVIREAWLLVPIKATEEMERAGWIDKEDVSPSEIYAAMLRASGLSATARSDEQSKVVEPASEISRRSSDIAEALDLCRFALLRTERTEANVTALLESFRDRIRATPATESALTSNGLQAQVWEAAIAAASGTTESVARADLTDERILTIAGETLPHWMRHHEEAESDDFIAFARAILATESADRRDAARYRCLRAQNWMESKITVANVKDIRLGGETFTHERLDSAIDCLLESE